MNLARIRELASRYRLPLLALLASAGLHAAVVVGLPGRMAALRRASIPPTR